MRLVQDFACDETAATAIEYGLMAGLIAVACIMAFVAFGNSLSGMFQYIQDRAGNAMDAAAG
ncbi:MAG TPA: Flp family type IVb pilin [Devosia sp.]|nr:Flp family type IVb pilin [Devosia sp.]